MFVRSILLLKVLFLLSIFNQITDSQSVGVINTSKCSRFVTEVYDINRSQNCFIKSYGKTQISIDYPKFETKFDIKRSKRETFDPKHSVCGDVIQATSIGDYLLMITKRPLKKEYEVIRTIYYDQDDTFKDKFEAEISSVMTKVLKDISSIKNMFSIQYNEWDISIKNQDGFRTRVFLFWSNRDRNTTAVEFIKETVIFRWVATPFSVINVQNVYDGNQISVDNSEFINLKLLYLHFPKEVEIIQILVIKVRVGVEKPHKMMFLALVYTSVKLDDNSELLVRHNMFGYHEGSYGYNIPYSTSTIRGYPIFWQFDDLQDCTRMPYRISAVAKLKSVQHKNGSFQYTFAEFSSFHYKKSEIFFTKIGPQKYDIKEVSAWNPNQQLLNCGSMPLPIDEGLYCKSDAKISVLSATSVDKYLLLTIRIPNSELISIPGSGVKPFEVISTVYYSDTDGTPDNQRYQAKRSDELSKILNSRPTKFMFKFEYDFKLNIGLKFRHFIYLLSSQKNRTTSAIELQLSPSTPSKPFGVIGGQTVYDESGHDQSDLLNLRLLYLHFPEEVEIYDILVINPNIGKVLQTCFALVYTKEILENTTTVLISRHYMTGKTHKHSDRSVKDFLRIHWEYDIRHNYCTKLNDNIEAVVQLKYELIDQDHSRYIFAEFCGYLHIKYEMRVTHSDQFVGYLFEVISKDSKPEDNRLLMSCPPN